MATVVPAFAGGEKSTWCHDMGNGAFSVVMVGTGAYDSHKGHGDVNIYPLFETTEVACLAQNDA